MCMGSKIKMHRDAIETQTDWQRQIDEVDWLEIDCATAVTEVFYPLKYESIFFSFEVNEPIRCNKLRQMRQRELLIAAALLL